MNFTFRDQFFINEMGNYVAPVDNPWRYDNVRHEPQHDIKKIFMNSR